MGQVVQVAGGEAGEGDEEVNGDLEMMTCGVFAITNCAATAWRLHFGEQSRSPTESLHGARQMPWKP